MTRPDLPSLRPSTWFIVAGIAMIVVFTAATAAMAPPVHQANTDRVDGTTLVGAMGAGHDGGAYLLDETGETVWKYHGGTVSINDVSRLPSGNILAAYQTENTTAAACDGLEPPCGRTGARVINPETNEVVWEWSFATKTVPNSEVHDVEYLPEQSAFVFVDMDRERLFVLDRESKEIVWQWNASEHYEAPDNPTERDWLHINDVDHIGDGRYLISVRNANQLLIVERGEGVVEVINKDHGTATDHCRGALDNQMVGENPRCGSPDVLDHQHNPQWLGNGSVLVADSENDRVVELERQSDGNWSVAWVSYGANGVAYDWPRDADRLPNGNTLVLDTRNNRLVEITEHGDVVWSTAIPEQGYDADRLGGEYPAGAPYGSDGQIADKRLNQPFGIVATLYGAIRHTFPLPFWVGEWHVLVSGVGLTLVLYGLGIRGFIGLRQLVSRTAEGARG